MEPQDIELTSPPTDGISGLSFCPVADYLAVSSWDGQIRIYEVQPSGNTVPKTSYAHDGPALCVGWSKDGSKVVSGGGDKTVRMTDMNTGQTTQVAEHAEPVKAVKFLDNNPSIMATGSWDKTIKYWDLRSPQPVSTAQLPERLYSMDTKNNLLVAATADRHILLYDLNNPTTVFKQAPSPLKWQTRVVSCFIDGKGCAIGSIEGRVGIQYVQEADASRSFSFKCHRDEQKNVFAVNDISFHPIHGTFSTAGADGTFSFWDKDSKQRIKTFPKKNGTISSTAFSRNGAIFAYAVSYDWTKGYKFAAPNEQHKIYLHATREDEVKPRVGKR
ncbi:WD40-repeat-containing domain protein [Fennellomyces sp. T-0311]|nr:WD40-repeat-containing domain protein [Fennellomyces sp. T-0311]KAI8143428.1 WD40-repeat-containing domain protein [Fennellomyces sp. T-0311]